jgi:hypothetical protein
LGAKGAAISTALSCIMLFWIRTMFARKLWCNFSIKYYIIIQFLFLVLIQIIDFRLSKYYEIITVLFILSIIFLMIKKQLNILFSTIKKLF